MLPKNLPPDLEWIRNERLEFSPRTTEHLRHYVYPLMHPLDGHVFYVGEGQGQRVYDHLISAVRLMADGALQTIADDETDPEHSEKLGTIAAILRSGRLPRMSIVRDGISTQQEAQRVEGALIDVLDYLSSLDRAVPPLTNLQAGHGFASFRSVEDVEATHGQSFRMSDLPGWKEGEEVLFLNINRRWGEVASNKNSVYAVTRGWWRLSSARAGRVRIVVVHAWGIVRAVFEVGGWESPNPDGRIAFNALDPGGLAGPPFKDRNLGTVLGTGGGQGSQSPVRYASH